MINVAINGFGRIGRMVLRAGWNDKKINFVAINDPGETKMMAHLLKYDSVHGPFTENVSYTANSLIIGKKKIIVTGEKDPTKLDWKKHKIDVVVECTGHFTKPQDASIHLKQGAKKVLISAPCKCDPKEWPKNAVTLVMGVNEKDYKKSTHHIISNASCTTNCVAPVLKVIQDAIGINQCFFTTVHAYTATEHLVDGAGDKDVRRTRAAGINIIPTSSGADIAVIQAIPSLTGKVRGSAFRVPVVDGSVTTFSIETKKDVTPEMVNKFLLQAAKGKMKGILEYSTDELVSTDIIHNPHSTIVDSLLTTVVNKRLLEVVAWYDNEWGYSCRMVDMIKHIS
ncbi:type I glyceraldehyde-3-phosphate dehydrogenase [Candidatus Woesearchaeota archaeon]|nr:type I glyceraldehyde-3-phosphate dehydrogenase [Candidatus Woesearchaeota archaeon]